MFEVVEKTEFEILRNGKPILSKISSKNLASAIVAELEIADINWDNPDLWIPVNRAIAQVGSLH